MCPVNKLMIAAIAESGGFGKFLGTNKKGISVYKDIACDSSVTVTSLKKGNFFKQITQVPVVEENRDVWVPHVKKGVHTLAHNYETGITTEVKNLKVDYLVPFKEFNAKFLSGIRNEFSVNRFKQNRKLEKVPVGEKFVRITAPNFIHETKVRSQADGGSLSVAFSRFGTDSNFVLDQFMTAQDFKMQDGSLLNGRTAHRRIHKEIGGKVQETTEDLLKKHHSAWGNV